MILTQVFKTYRTTFFCCIQLPQIHRRFGFNQKSFMKITLIMLYWKKVAHLFLTNKEEMSNRNKLDSFVCLIDLLSIDPQVHNYFSPRKGHGIEYYSKVVFFFFIEKYIFWVANAWFSRSQWRLESSSKPSPTIHFLSSTWLFCFHYSTEQTNCWYLGALASQFTVPFIERHYAYKSLS